VTVPGWPDLVLLALAGLVAGAVNTVAGAGSLLLLPTLIWTGLPADAANATNRIGILAQTTMAVVGFRRAGLRVEGSELRMVGLVTAGGVLGALVATRLSPRSMELAIVAAMVAMLALSLAPSRTPDAKALVPGAARPAALSPALMLGLALVGVYGGFLQAGLGIVLVLVLSRSGAMDLVRANLVKSAATLALTLVAMAVFWSAGETLDPWRGGALACGSAVGGLVGARATVRLGPEVVRRVIVLAIVGALAKMLWDLAHR
jgi:uncharacterized membrane protein YfcA